MSNPMHGDLVELRIRVQPDVAAWLKAEAQRLGNLVRTETVAATMLEHAVDAKRYDRALDRALQHARLDATDTPEAQP